MSTDYVHVLVVAGKPVALSPAGDTHHRSDPAPLIEDFLGCVKHYLRHEVEIYRVGMALPPRSKKGWPEPQLVWRWSPPCCEECGGRVKPDPSGSPGVWVHDDDVDHNDAYFRGEDRDRDHVALPPEEVT